MREIEADVGSPPVAEAAGRGVVRDLRLVDCVMVVAGSMIGSGIFIVPADIVRRMGSSGWLLLVWLAATSLIVCCALAYGELAAMMPQVGGQYIYLRETWGPLVGFLFGWSMFLVIQSGTIAAVAVGFARFLGVLVPAVSAGAYLIPPLPLSRGYAVSLSVQQAVAVALIALLTYLNTRGLRTGKVIQNLFTSAKTLALLALVVLGLTLGAKNGAFSSNLAKPWARSAVETVQPGAGLGSTFLLAMVGALFSCGAWNDVSFAGDEIREPRRTLPRALVLGTALVGGLYLLANLAYLSVLPLPAIAHAPEDRVATAAMSALFGTAGGTAMAISRGRRRLWTTRCRRRLWGTARSLRSRPRLGG